MNKGTIKLLQLSNVTGGEGLPPNYYGYCTILMLKGSSNYGMMIMLTISNNNVLYTKMCTSTTGAGTWYKTDRN